ncbi:MAG: hypothetical protein AAB341_03725 [Planctomycetota bacterium]
MIRRLVPDFHRQVLAVNRVERLLLKLTGTLDKAGVPYAIIGGNAVAAWVATVDEGAVRATKDVDVLLRRADLDFAAKALAGVSLDLHEVLGVSMFLPRRNPNPKTGVHVIFAGEKVRERDAHPFPDVTASQRSRAGFLVLDLPMLVRMKLVAFRRVDQVHIEDLIAVGLIDDAVVRSLPDDLLPRLEEIRTTE